MRWLVDGMNVIGSRPDRWWKDRDAAMLRLVDLLERWAAHEGEDVTVVFERAPRPPIRSTVIDVLHAPQPQAERRRRRDRPPARGRGASRRRSASSPRTAGWPTALERSARRSRAPSRSARGSSRVDPTRQPATIAQVSRRAFATPADRRRSPPRRPARPARADKALPPRLAGHPRSRRARRAPDTGSASPAPQRPVARGRRSCSGCWR